MPELVRREARRQEAVATLGQQFVGPLHRGGHHLRPGVVLVAHRPGGGGEGQVAELAPTSGLLAGAMGGQFVAEGGQHVHLAHARVGLGAADEQAASGEIHVRPHQGAGLADPQPGEDERREQRSPIVGARRRSAIEVGRRIEQRRNLLG